MQRTLSLIVDKQSKVYLPLITGDSFEIDKFTTKFDNATELRKEYKEKIDDFLKQNVAYVDKMKYRLNNLKFDGWIAILEEQDDEIVERKALFRKHLDKYGALCADKELIKQLRDVDLSLNPEERLLSEFSHELIQIYLGEKIDSSHNRQDALELLKKDMKYTVKDGKKEIKTVFYEILRLMYKIKNVLDAEKMVQMVSLEEEKEKYNIDGYSYSREEEELFDLDDLSQMEDTDFTPDGLGRNGKNFR